MKHKIVFIGNSIVNGFPFSRGKSFVGQIRAALKEGRSLDFEESSSAVDEESSSAVDEESSSAVDGESSSAVNGESSSVDDAKATDGAVPKATDGAGKKRVITADVINKGENGQTTADIMQRFEHDVIDHAPAAAFIMTGTNDFIFNEATPGQAFENLEDMAKRAEASGTVPVYMTPIHVDADLAAKMWMAGLGIDYDRVNEQVDELSEMIRSSGRLHVDTNIAYKRYATGSTGDPSDGGDSAGEGDASDGGDSAGGGGTAAYHDGVHPTTEGYTFIAQVVLEWILEHHKELRL